MTTLPRFAVGIFLAVLLLAPLSASAFSLSFGGRVLAVIPCKSVLGPSLYVTIIPAGLFPATYIWTPATITFSAGPPRTIGQQVLGLYDLPFFCTVGFTPFFGLRMFMVGTSLI
ncbi:MAG TPA: hypothetical protein VJZ94_03700 [Candidatus Paceibacterota bacterium]|uniref:Uncharacterized protein n=1 Tax=Candidatus Adlerbacteria bacterium RIFCSPLOWO2_01_FULL_51_16 TaxID=1797243 RepID=A0A1F4XFC2_9BACT|nr:MAG: hypothetical protein A2943_01215 [Candidatus Adlerbacteria bacterium RIFCSPLOWO2_01_FULL_51_16]HXK31795.1 hypothetical protein [Candidatus Paceibacterota bacterium]